MVGDSKVAALNYTEDDKRSLYQALLYGRKRAGEWSIAMTYYHRRIFWWMFMREVDAAAAALLARGIKKGDMVTIFMPNIPQSIIALYAINRIGAIANMLHPLSTTEEAHYAINLTNSKLVFTIELNEEKVSDCDIEVIRCTTGKYFPCSPRGLILKAGYAFALRNNKSAHNVKSITKWTKFLKEGREKLRSGFELPIEDGKPEDTAVIMYTGGTTGTSKGVMLSNYAVNTISMQMLIEVGEGKTDVGDGFLALLPIFHAFGLAVTVHAPLISGKSSLLTTESMRRAPDSMLLQRRMISSRTASVYSRSAL